MHRAKKVRFDFWNHKKIAKSSNSDLAFLVVFISYSTVDVRDPVFFNIATDAPCFQVNIVSCKSWKSSSTEMNQIGSVSEIFPLILQLLVANSLRTEREKTVH